MQETEPKAELRSDHDGAKGMTEYLDVALSLVRPPAGNIASPSVEDSSIANSRWLALTGVCCALIPMSGPCYILAVPLGVWARVVMHRQNTIAAFEPKVLRQSKRLISPHSQHP